MKALYMPNGNLQFRTISNLEMFDQKIKNSLGIFSVETFWDTRKGLNFNVMSSRLGNYKLEHMRNKLIEWYGEEADFSEVKNKKKVGSTMYGTIQYIHKIYGQSEVTLNG